MADKRRTYPQRKNRHWPINIWISQPLLIILVVSMKCQVFTQVYFGTLGLMYLCPQMRTSSGQKSFNYHGAKVPKDFDSETTLVSSILCFKWKLKNDTSPQCWKFRFPSLLLFRSLVCKALIDYSRWKSKNRILSVYLCVWKLYVVVFPRANCYACFY